MYGTVARMRLKPGAEALFDAQMKSMSNLALGDLGWVSTMIYRSDDDAREVWMVVVFDSRESYQANAARPNQDMHYRLMRGCLESDPEWHDGEIVGQLPGDWLLRTKETEWGRHEG
jgi:heme-degrading monooxygenase HmoA